MQFESQVHLTFNVEKDIFVFPCGFQMFLVCFCMMCLFKLTSDENLRGQMSHISPCFFSLYYLFK